jgi:hypothetical protein
MSTKANYFVFFRILQTGLNNKVIYVSGCKLFLVTTKCFKNIFFGLTEGNTFSIGSKRGLDYPTAALRVVGKKIN